MPTEDNRLDLLEMLDKDGYDYCLISLAKGKNQDKADVNLKIPTKRSAHTMLEILDNIMGYLIEFIESKPPKKRKKRK